MILSSGLPNWQLFLSQVEIPNLGKRYTWRKTQIPIIKINHHPLIRFLLFFCFATINNPSHLYYIFNSHSSRLWRSSCSGKPAWRGGTARWQSAAQAFAGTGWSAWKWWHKTGGITLPAWRTGQFFFLIRRKNQLLKVFSTFVTFEFVNRHLYSYSMKKLLSHNQSRHFKLINFLPVFLDSQLC